MLHHLIGTLMFAAVSVAASQILSFDKDTVGKVPAGFSTALTGKGKPGTWVVLKEESAPSGPNVLAQTDMDKTSYRFPVCIYDGTSAKDVDVSVKIKPIKGSEDQAGGIVWRYQNKDNYYIVRANAAEDNVVLYKVKKGKRTDLPLKGKGRTYGMDVKVPNGKWSTLQVIARGDQFEVVFNGKKLYEVEDKTFTQAGKVGVWTKADSYMLFDDLSIRVLDRAE